MMTYLTHVLMHCRLALFLLVFLGFAGCEPLYHRSMFTEPAQVTMPVAIAPEEVWITSIPSGADVYIMPYTPEEVPSHIVEPTQRRGQTPLRLSLEPGTYWVELALDAEVFQAYFSPPYEDAQFEPDGASSEALLFRPLTPGEKRRVLRYYRLEKSPIAGQTVIGLFHPRGESTERAAALYPQGDSYRFTAESLVELFREAQVPGYIQESLFALLRRGGKAVWSQGGTLTMALELRDRAVAGHIVSLYTGPPLPNPLIPDGGGF